MFQSRKRESSLIFNNFNDFTVSRNLQQNSMISQTSTDNRHRDRRDFFSNIRSVYNVHELFNAGHVFNRNWSMLIGRSPTAADITRKALDSPCTIIRAEVIPFDMNTELPAALTSNSIAVNEQDDVVISVPVAKKPKLMKTNGDACSPLTCLTIKKDVSVMLPIGAASTVSLWKEQRCGVETALVTDPLQDVIYFDAQCWAKRTTFLLCDWCSHYEDGKASQRMLQHLQTSSHGSASRMQRCLVVDQSVVVVDLPYQLNTFQPSLDLIAICPTCYVPFENCHQVGQHHVLHHPGRQRNYALVSMRSSQIVIFGCFSECLSCRLQFQSATTLRNHWKCQPRCCPFPILSLRQDDPLLIVMDCQYCVKRFIFVWPPSRSSVYQKSKGESSVIDLTEEVDCQMWFEDAWKHVCAKHVRNASISDKKWAQQNLRVTLFSLKDLHVECLPPFAGNGQPVIRLRSLYVNMRQVMQRILCNPNSCRIDQRLNDDFHVLTSVQNELRCSRGVH